MSVRLAPIVTLVLAVAALAVSAIAQHDACTALGYRLAAARREALDLRRRVAAAEQRLALVRAPEAVLSRAVGMGLELDYPEQAPSVRSLRDISLRHISQRHMGTLGAVAELSMRGGGAER